MAFSLPANQLCSMEGGGQIWSSWHGRNVGEEEEEECTRHGLSSMDMAFKLNMEGRDCGRVLCLPL